MLLREKDKQTLLQIFSTVTIPVEVWVYGSRVNGTAHEGSDLDLVIRNQNLSPLPIETYAELSEKIKDSNIPILVELRDWAILPENFHRNIEQQYEVLFDNRKKVYQANPKYILKEPPAEYNTKAGNEDADKLR